GGAAANAAVGGATRRDAGALRSTVIAGAGSELVMTMTAAAMVSAPAANANGAVRTLSLRPWRMGSSSSRADIAAAARLTPTRSPASGTPETPVRASLSHRKIGQWYRYVP